MNHRVDESVFCAEDDEEQHSSSSPPLHDDDPINASLSSSRTALATTAAAAKNTNTTTTTTTMTSATCAPTPPPPPPQSPPQPLPDEKPPSFSRSHPTIATLHHLTAFSVLGLSLRVFLGRLLGGDCHLPPTSSSIDDWLAPLSTHTCVTSHDGALFVDLPANMLGSFLLGMATTYPRGRSSSSSPFDVGIRTGLCGNVTTFSSWNSAMISLLVGTTTTTKERNVAAACFGYVLGTMGATESFRGGRTVAAWWRWRWRWQGKREKEERVKGEEFEEGDMEREKEEANQEEMEIRPTLQPTGYGMSSAIHALPTILSLVLLSLYLIGDLYWNIPHYRALWMASLLSPLGTYCRWKLSKFNQAPNPLRRCQRRPRRHPQTSPSPPSRWFPLGTFLANLSGSIVSAAIAALLTSPSFSSHPSSSTTAVLRALSLGFAGGLSTVSTFASEVVALSEGHPPPHEMKAFGYWIMTVGVCCLVGLGVFCILVQVV